MTMSTRKMNFCFIIFDYSHMASLNESDIHYARGGARRLRSDSSAPLVPINALRSSDSQDEDKENKFTELEKRQLRLENAVKQMIIDMEHVNKQISKINHKICKILKKELY